MNSSSSFSSSDFSDHGDTAQPTFARDHPHQFPTYLYPNGTFALDGISFRAGALGFVCAISLNATWALRASYPQLPFFVAVLTFFHFMEFWITARYNTRRAKVGAFILTSNGAAYNIAHLSAVLEASIEYYFFPGLKQHTWVIGIGLALLAVGQVTRTYAMKHAGSNFSHYVATRHEAGHALVTSGIYAYLRHPSYFGYYWWAIGTQVMLGNPVCTLGFAAFLWKFFNSRIQHEEAYLTSFFKADYRAYKKQSWVGIPFIA